MAGGLLRSGLGAGVEPVVAKPPANPFVSVVSDRLFKSRTQLGCGFQARCQCLLTVGCERL